MELNVTITPGVSPTDRATLEDGLVEELGGDADCVGGGTLMGDPIESDFTVVFADRDPGEVLTTTSLFMKGVGFSKSTRVDIDIDGVVTTIVTGGDSEG